MTLTIRSEDFDTFEDYCDALRRCKWLTPSEYATLLSQEIDAGEEYYGEIYAQYRSECAMFGDAGPGQGLAVRDTGRQLAESRARLATVRRIIANLAA
jgi:hypothetical protein